MTFQMKLLMQMATGQTETGDIILNPFYDTSPEYIIANLSKAEMTYKNVWRRFLTVWYLRYKVDELPIPPREWETFSVDTEAKRA